MKEPDRGPLQALPGEEIASVKALWEPLSEDAKLVVRAACLFDPEGIPADALAALFDAADWGKEQFDAACDEARQSALLTQEGEGFRMPLHVASFVAGKAEPELPETMLEAHVEAFVAAAKLAVEQPSEAGPAAWLFAYPLHPEAWEALGEAVQASVSSHGAICVVDALLALGRDDQVGAWCEHGVRWCERALEREAEGSETALVLEVNLASLLSEIGGRHMDRDAWEEAFTYMVRATEVCEQLTNAGVHVWEDLGFTLISAGVSQLCMVRPAEALPWFERAVVAFEKGDEEGNVNHAQLSEAAFRIAHCLADCDRPDEAMQWFERAMTERNEQHQGDAQGQVPPNVFGTMVPRIGSCLNRQNRHAEAIQWFERLVDLLANEGERNESRLAVIVESLSEMGMAHRAMNRHDDASRCFMRAAELCATAADDFPSFRSMLAQHALEAGTSLFMLERSQEAIEWFKRSIETEQKEDAAGQIDHNSIGTGLHWIGRAHFQLGRHEEAIGWFERSIEAHQQGDTLGKVDHHEIADSLHWIGECLRKLGRAKEALDVLERAVGEAERGDVLGRVKPERLDAIRVVRDELRAVLDAASQG